MDVRVTRETPPTRFDAFARFINGPQLVAVILQKMRPSSKAGRNFQDRPGRQTIANPWKDRAGPLRGGSAPRLRPFLARLFPIVFHGVTGTIKHSSKYGW